jgi:hypothetical protein
LARTVLNYKKYDLDDIDQQIVAKGIAEGELSEKVMRMLSKRRDYQAMRVARTLFFGKGYQPPGSLPQT